MLEMEGSRREVMAYTAELGQRALALVCEYALVADNLEHLPDVMARALALVCEVVGWDAAALFVLREDARRLDEVTRLAVTDPFRLTYETTREGHVPASLARVWLSDPSEVVVLGPPGTSDWGPSEVIGTRPQTLAWGAAASLHVGDRIKGVLVAGTRDGAPLCAGERALVAQLGRLLARTLDRVTELDLLAQREAIARTVLAESPDAITLYDPHADCFIDANPKAERLLGASLETLQDTLVGDLGVPELVVALSMVELGISEPRQIVLGEVCCDVSSSTLDIDGQTLIMSVYRRVPKPKAAPPEPITRPTRAAAPADAAVQVRMDERPAPASWTVSQELVARTDSASQAPPTPARAARDPLRDTLTQLASPALFTNRLEHALKRLRRHPDAGFAVVVLDLDRFHTINARFGWRAGCDLLYEAARRLESALRSTDTACRLRDDEFAVLIEDQDSIEGAERVVQRLLDALHTPFNVGDTSVTMTASAGLTTSALGYLLPELVIQDARVSMRSAKQRGGGAVGVFDVSVDVSLDTMRTTYTKDRGAVSSA